MPLQLLTNGKLLYQDGDLRTECCCVADKWCRIRWEEDDYCNPTSGNWDQPPPSIVAAETECFEEQPEDRGWVCFAATDFSVTVRWDEIRQSNCNNDTDCYNLDWEDGNKQYPTHDCCEYYCHLAWLWQDYPADFFEPGSPEMVCPIFTLSFCTCKVYDGSHGNGWVCNPYVGLGEDYYYQELKRCVVDDQAGFCLSDDCWNRFEELGNAWNQGGDIDMLPWWTSPETCYTPGLFNSISGC